MKRKWERNTTVVEPFFVTLWFFKVEAGHSVSRLYFLYLYVCVCMFLGRALRWVSSLLTQTVNSSTGKACPSGALYFSNNTPLVRLFHVYDLNK